jgi:hypothetical protein
MKTTFGSLAEFVGNVDEELSGAVNRPTFLVERRADEVIPQFERRGAQDRPAVRLTEETLCHAAFGKTDHVECLVQAREDSVMKVQAAERDPSTPPGSAQDDNGEAERRVRSCRPLFLWCRSHIIFI